MEKTKVSSSNALLALLILSTLIAPCEEGSVTATTGFGHGLHSECHVLSPSLLCHASRNHRDFTSPSPEAKPLCHETGGGGGRGGILNNRQGLHLSDGLVSVPACC